MPELGSIRCIWELSMKDDCDFIVGQRDMHGILAGSAIFSFRHQGSLNERK